MAGKCEAQDGRRVGGTCCPDEGLPRKVTAIKSVVPEALNQLQPQSYGLYKC